MRSLHALETLAAVLELGGRALVATLVLRRAGGHTLQLHLSVEQRAPQAREVGRGRLGASRGGAALLVRLSDLQQNAPLRPGDISGAASKSNH